jgi:ABC-type proline/glycine betaine transport system ATPase subunit
MRMQDEIIALWQARGTTMVLVTHYVDEAIYMSDRIVVMTPRPGRIVREFANPLERPRDRSSSDFQALRAEILNTLHLAEKESAADNNRSGSLPLANPGGLEGHLRARKNGRMTVAQGSARAGDAP